MILSRLVDHGATRIRARFWEATFAKTGLDRTHPVHFQCSVTDRCNYACQYCNHWSRSTYSDEMTLAEWQNAIRGIKRFPGKALLQFTGGEPFVWPHFADLGLFCADEGVDWDVITNGSAFHNAKVVRAVVSARPLKVDISVDGANPAVHDLARGVDGSLNRIERGLSLLRAERDRIGVTFPIRIKTTVSRINVSHLEPLAEWAEKHGASAIDFNLATRWGGVYDPPVLDRQDDDVEIRRQINLLKEAEKRVGVAISLMGLNTVSSYKQAPCRQSLRDFNISPNGDVRSCKCSPVLGNLRDSEPTEIWSGSIAKAVRTKSKGCTMAIAEIREAISCNSNRSILKDIRRALTIKS